MTTPHPSTPTHLSPHRKALYILLPILLLTLILSYILISSQIKRSNEIRDEEQQFMTLKQDMLALQTEFNKIDKGWEYGEGCYDNGQVYSRGSVDSCSLGINNSKISADRVTQEKFNEYLALLYKRGWNQSAAPQYKMGEYSIYTYKFAEIGCALNLSTNSPIGALNCNGSARNMYFKYQSN